MARTPKDTVNDLIRRIAQVCGTCKHGQGKGRGLVCTRKHQCPSKNVRRWLKELGQIQNSIEGCLKKS